MFALLDAATCARDRCMLAVAINTGLWASELTSIRLRDVDLQAQTLHVVGHCWLPPRRR